MKKIGLFLSFIFMAFMITFLSSCETKEYKIMFTDYDGTVLYSENIKEGEIPSYPLQEPIRSSDSDYTYTFSDWFPSIEKATKDTIYTAYYKKVLKQEYTVTFKNYDGTVLYSEIVKEGLKPEYLGDKPLKPHDDTNKYLFNGWDKEITRVTGDTTYTASFKSFDLEKYVVVFQYEDETLIDAYEASEGDIAVYNGETPTMEKTEDAKYRFRGWSPALGEVKEDIIYTAKFIAEPLNYFVSVNSNGGESASGKKIESFKTDELNASQLVYDVVKDNYRFDGWEYNGEIIFDENGNTLVNLDDIDFESNISLTAHFKEEAFVNITYVVYNEVNDQVIGRYKELPSKYGTGSLGGFHEWNASTKLNVELASNERYEFDGWYENTNIVSIKPSFDYYLFDKDVDIECKFIVKKFTLDMYVNNDELGEIMVKNYTDWESSIKTDFYYGEQIVVAAKSISDIEFLGWYNYYDELITNDEYCIVEVGYTMALKAKWDYFKINYMIPAGIENDDNPTYYTSKTENITLVNPTSEFFGMAFECWLSENNLSPITEIDTSKLEDLNIYASYINDPDYNFDLNKPKNIINAIIPTKVKEIPSEAFSLCENLKTILLPKELTTIGLDAFKNCVNLEKVYYDGTIDDWLHMELFWSRETNPMYYASEFYILDSNGEEEYNGKKYSLLTDLEVVDYTEDDLISLYKFTGFECIKTLTIGSICRGFGIDAFYGCDIEKFYYNGTIDRWCSLVFGTGNLTSNPMMVSKNIYFYDENGTVTHNGLKYSILTSVTIPQNIVTLNPCVFAGCESLKTVTFASNSNLLNVGNYAFYGCKNLKSVYFSSYFKTIGDYAFADCISLATIEVSPYGSPMWQYVTKGKEWHRNVPATHIKFPDGYLPIE